MPGTANSLRQASAPALFCAAHHAEWQIVAVLAGGLALDAGLGWPGQIAANIWVIAVFCWLWRRGASGDRRLLLFCAVIAGTGEVILSLAWGLYDYQFHNIPLFVPPGHALLMTLGLLIARRVPAWTVWLVPAVALPMVAVGWWQGWDTSGPILFGLFLACVAGGEARRLYATMFVLALLLELYGTWLGNWVWRPVVPGMSLTTTNPPACSGVFYCLLDLLVLGAMRLRLRAGGLPCPKPASLLPAPGLRRT